VLRRTVAKDARAPVCETQVLRVQGWLSRGRRRVSVGLWHEGGWGSEWLGWLVWLGEWRRWESGLSGISD